MLSLPCFVSITLNIKEGHIITLNINTRFIIILNIKRTLIILFYYNSWPLFFPLFTLFHFPSRFHSHYIVREMNKGQRDKERIMFISLVKGMRNECFLYI